MISLLLTGKPYATTGLADLGHAKKLNRCKRPGIDLFGSTIFSFFPETLQICGSYDMIQGVVATVGRPIQNSLPRVLGGRDRFIRRADLNFKTVFLVAMATVEGPCGGGSRSFLPFIWCKHIVLKSLNLV